MISDTNALSAWADGQSSVRSHLQSAIRAVVPAVALKVRLGEVEDVCLLSAMTITLTPDQEKLVAERLGRGIYRSPEQVAAAAFQALEVEEARERKLIELRRDLQTGLDDIERGDVVGGPEAMARQLERCHRRLETAP